MALLRVMQKKIIDNFHEMVFYSLSQHDETKALQMFLGSSYAETKEMLEKYRDRVMIGVFYLKT